MNIKVLKEYLGLCESVGAVGTPGGFYSYVGDNYPELQRKMKPEIIEKMWVSL